MPDYAKKIQGRLWWDNVPIWASPNTGYAQAANRDEMLCLLRALDGLGTWAAGEAMRGSQSSGAALGLYELRAPRGLGPGSQGGVKSVDLAGRLAVRWCAQLNDGLGQT